ncbi:MAG: M20/M25/M40 family metallo-hydrolase, partial [Anaerolineaceae bacterium]|nr:M20/M25/M40 family metallo-hydrolase [Anaerolineaceae bacterium]
MLYGRGSGDMKSGVAAMVTAMRALKESGADFNGRLQLWCTPDEETHGAYGSEYMVLNHPDIVKTDATVISEARSQAPLQTPVITIGEKGPHWLRFTFYGASGHGSIPKQKSNALNKAVRFMANAEEYFEIPKPHMPINAFKYYLSYLKRYQLFDLLRLLSKKKKPDNPYEKDVRKLRTTFETTYSFNIIRAGRKVNIIPDRCELDVDFRVLPGLSSQGLMDAISNYCTILGYKVELPEGFTNKQEKKRSFKDEPVDVRVSVITIGEGFFVDKKSDFGAALGNAFEAVYETAPVHTFASGFSDSGNMIAGGMHDVFNIGPHGYNHHNANEHVDIESVISAAKLYLFTAYRFLNN